MSITNVEISPFDYVNFSCKKGDVFERTIEVKNEDDSLFDFTDYTAKMQIRKGEGGAVIETFDSEDNSIVLTEGEVTLAKNAISGASGNYYYDLQITKDEKSRTIISGRFVIHPDYTE